ncbi:MAG TPA: CBS domain-containing protein, partial [Candidatus Tumulicola sp.]|nr:CBS domain-containing protein [Candidatus Tumulicola sp.]
RVGAVVGPKQIAVRAEVTIRELRGLLAEAPASTVLVVDQDNRLLGTIDSSSLEQAPAAAPTILRMRARTAIAETASVAEAVDCLVHSHSRSVAVVDKDDRAVGVLTDVELLRWFARHGND